MKQRLLAGTFTAASLWMVTGTLFAHHNQAAFNTAVTTVVTGTVKEFNWMNPHSMLIVNGKDEKGEVVEWAIEMAPPNSLHRDNGWTDQTFKPGDHVTVEGNAYKDGRKIMRPKKINMPDGKDFVGRF